jgi:hypothetical protein
MKKWLLITFVIFTLLLAGCNFPGFDRDAALDPDDAMATEIARILTGTPVLVETPDEIIEPTEPVDVLPTPTDVVVEPTPAPTDTPAPTPTATLAGTDPALNLGTPDWVDDMSDDENWLTGIDQFTSVRFDDGYMKLTARTEFDGWRVSWPNLDNFYLEATLQTPECGGNDHFGFIFRVPADSQAGKGYLFAITCDGRYSLRRWDGTTMHSLVALTAHTSIQQGADVVNVIGVMARGANLALYINGQKVNEVTDSNYLEGRFGIFVGGTNVSNLTVWVDQIRYWEDP